MKFAKTTFALLVLAVALASAVRTNQKSEKTHKKDLIKEKVLGSDAAAQNTNEFMQLQTSTGAQQKQQDNKCSEECNCESLQEQYKILSEELEDIDALQKETLEIIKADNAKELAAQIEQLKAKFQSQLESDQDKAKDEFAEKTKKITEKIQNVKDQAGNGCNLAGGDGQGVNSDILRNENERKYFNQILGDKLNGKNPVAFWSTVEDSSCNVDQFKQADAKYYTYDQIYLIEDTVGNRFGFFMPAQEKLLVNHWYVPNINGAINTKDSFLFSLNGQRKQMCQNAGGWCFARDNRHVLWAADVYVLGNCKNIQNNRALEGGYYGKLIRESAPNGQNFQVKELTVIALVPK